MASFPLPVKASINDEFSMPVRMVQFGDGYKERAKNGLNRPREVWSVEVAFASKAAGANLQAFLVEHGQDLMFQWQSPRDIYPQNYVILGGVSGSFRRGGGDKPVFFTRSMKFERVWPEVLNPYPGFGYGAELVLPRVAVAMAPGYVDPVLTANNTVYLRVSIDSYQSADFEVRIRLAKSIGVGLLSVLNVQFYPLIDIDNPVVTIPVGFDFVDVLVALNTQSLRGGADGGFIFQIASNSGYVVSERSEVFLMAKPPY